MRQQLLFLYLSSSALDSDVVAWSSYDGTARTTPTTGDGTEPPYPTGTDALAAGWRMIQCSQLMPPQAGNEYSTSYLRHEFVFEKLVTIEA
ncbi:hypothetical protein [Kitasatospora viridis]|uniref:hypothetical protein n=1 Tax=Kitasatospora viridis TaxID=281105 RepID=UPI0011A1E736|nr:hypothetical protein [Kitasatospora viridis]